MRKGEESPQKKRRTGKIIGLVVLVLLLVVVFRFGRTIYSTVRGYLNTVTDQPETEEKATDVILSEESIAAESEGKYGSDWAEHARSAAVGDTILLGMYEQDGIEENGREDIEWIVIEKEDNALLLLSRYVLDGYVYANDRDYNDLLNWKTSTLRRWMHEVMLKNAFSAEALQYIQPVHFTSEAFPDGTVRDTWDVIFFPEEETVWRVFKDEEARRAEATPYAVSRGVPTVKDSDAGTLASWGLYSWYETEQLLSVEPYGTLCEGGGIFSEVEIRPCIRINLDPEYLAREEARITALGSEQYRALKSACEESTLTLGCYEQDADSANGQEPIEWLVLENDETTLKLVSKTILDVMDFSTMEFASAEEAEEVELDACGYPCNTPALVSQWLNTDFVSAAFSPEEQALLRASDEAGVLPVNLMTEEEVKLYFPTSTFIGERKKSCYVSPYAMTKYDGYAEAAKSADETDLELYWGNWMILGSSGQRLTVDIYGTILDNGYCFAIRPMIDIEW